MHVAEIRSGAWIPKEVDVDVDNPIPYYTIPVNENVMAGMSWRVMAGHDRCAPWVRTTGRGGGTLNVLSVGGWDISRWVFRHHYNPGCGGGWCQV